MRKLYWILYGIYFMVRLCLQTLWFQLIKKNMSSEAVENYAYKLSVGWAMRTINRSRSKVTVTGIENIPKETCLFVSNHQEYFDILVLIGYIPRPIGFIAKKELESIPFVSYWMKLKHCVFIARENPKESIKAILEGVENLKNGYSMHIAPEGTRSKGPELGEFKKGSLKLAIKAEVPVVPVTLNNVYKVTDGKGFLNIKAAEIEVVISEPIQTVGLSREEQNNLSETVRDIIKGNLKYDI